MRYDFNSDNSIASVENSPELAYAGIMDGSIRHDYQYDGLNRLVKAEGEVRINDHEAEYYKREFAYSPNGNLQTKKMTDRGTKTDSANWSYTYKNHAVTSVTQNGSSVFNMSYDACGNMTSQTDNHRDMIKNIAYDSKNRMISVTDKNGSIVSNYEYDEQGFRVRKTARAEGDDKTVEILYPSMYHGIERTKATARSTTDSDSYAVNNIYVNGVRIAAVSGDGAERHYFTDQVDSVKLVMDGDGKPIKAFEYLPYGETWLEKGESNDNPKYNSQELDKETGYYYYNARHYDAALARFVTADTVIDGEYSVAGWNRYMYCRGNPVRFKDPSGHNPIVIGLVVGAVVGIVFEFLSDATDGKFDSTVGDYILSAGIGAVSGVVGGPLGAIGNTLLKTGVTAATTGGLSALHQLGKNMMDENASWNDNLIESAAAGAIGGGATSLLGSAVSNFALRNNLGAISKVLYRYGSIGQKELSSAGHAAVTALGEASSEIIKNIAKGFLSEENDAPRESIIVNKNASPFYTQPMSDSNDDSSKYNKGTKDNDYTIDDFDWDKAPRIDRIIPQN